MSSMDGMDAADAGGGLYGELAEWWPVISAPEEYVEEAAVIVQMLESATDSDGITTLLELGCGGGNNAVHLKARYDLTLTDLSGGMIEVSRSANPGVEHVVADMRTVRLGRTFDAVLVYDAVSYLLTEADLALAMATAFEHCRPGGVALFVPDELTETYAPSTEHGGTDAADGRSARYLAWSHDPDPDDTWTVTEYAFLLRSADGTVRSVHDTHRTGLFGRETWLGRLRAAGFVAESITEPATVDWEPRELFVARRPTAGIDIV